MRTSARLSTRKGIELCRQPGRSAARERSKLTAESTLAFTHAMGIIWWLWQAAAATNEEEGGQQGDAAIAATSAALFDVPVVDMPPQMVVPPIGVGPEPAQVSCARYRLQLAPTFRATACSLAYRTFHIACCMMHLAEARV